MITLQVAGTDLPLNNLTQLKIGDELIWSSNTGRSASSGTMLGDIVAKKKTISLTFAWIRKTDFETILHTFDNSPFVSVLLKLDNTKLLDANCYRSNIDRELGGNQGGVWYYSSVSFDLIQQ